MGSQQWLYRSRYVVIAERSDMEVIGVHTIEGLGLAADPVQKKLVPTIGLALSAGVLI